LPPKAEHRPAGRELTMPRGATMSWQRRMAERTVLVVEDSEVIRRVISLLLEGEGYHVVATDRGLDALDLARQERPDAVTLDLALADADGREILRRLKDDADTRRIPVIILSAFTEALNPAERWYAADVIPKPFDVDDLLRRLDRAVQAEGSDHSEPEVDERRGA
jgi:CheY-like chemotaxis protein